MTYAFIFVLAVAPTLYLFKKSAFASKPIAQSLIFALISFLASLPLLLVFADYGRLIYFHATCLTFVALQMLNTYKNDTAEDTNASVLAWCLCLVFILGWRVTTLRAIPSTSFTPLRIYKSLQHASIPAERAQPLSVGARLSS
jgi:hypothetical protein